MSEDKFLATGECKKHNVQCCTRCRYGHTGRRESTDAFVSVDVVDFMNASYNKQLKELE